MATRSTAERTIDRLHANNATFRYLWDLLADSENEASIKRTIDNQLKRNNELITHLLTKRKSNMIEPQVKPTKRA